MKKRRRAPTRRDFALGLTAIGAAGAANAADSPAVKPVVKPAEESLLAVVRARYGKGLSEEQWQAVAQRVRGGLARAAELRKQPLRNSDDPSFAFRADLP